MRVARSCAICEAQLAASSSGISHIETVVTDGAPHAIMVDLQPAAGIGTISKAELAFGSVWICLSILVSSTFHTRVFVMTAVVLAPTIVIALINPVIVSTAGNVIHVNWVCTSPKPLNGLNCALAETQLAASGIGIINAESVVANGAPHAIMENLQPTASTGTIVEAEVTFGTRCIWGLVVVIALNTHVFVMTAIVAAPTTVIALIEPPLLITALKIIQ
jgi:hypothetical protein